MEELKSFGKRFKEVCTSGKNSYCKLISKSCDNLVTQFGGNTSISPLHTDFLRRDSYGEESSRSSGIDTLITSSEWTSYTDKSISSANDTFVLNSDDKHFDDWWFDSEISMSSTDEDYFDPATFVSSGDNKAFKNSKGCNRRSSDGKALISGSDEKCDAFPCSDSETSVSSCKTEVSMISCDSSNPIFPTPPITEKLPSGSRPSDTSKYLGGEHARFVTNVEKIVNPNESQNVKIISDCIIAIKISTSQTTKSSESIREKENIEPSKTNKSLDCGNKNSKHSLKRKDKGICSTS